MPEVTVVQFQKKEEAKFICSACGADRGCQCNAPAVPKAVRAAEALKANPEQSDRSIAEQIGASPTTVGKAREELSSSGQLEEGPRVGKDGKARKEPSAAEREERDRKRMERRAARRAEQLAENFPYAVEQICRSTTLSPYREDWDEENPLKIPESLTAKTAGGLRPHIRAAIENLEKLDTALAEIERGGAVLQ
jgi:DNA-binding Lrp family transcriptional regulator